MRFIWGIFIAVFLVQRYLVFSLGLLAVVAALLISKRVRLPQKFVQASMCLLLGYIIGAMWFSSHTNSSDFFPMQD